MKYVKNRSSTGRLKNAKKAHANFKNIDIRLIMYIVINTHY